jgi:hypothetical protein
MNALQNTPSIQNTSSKPSIQNIPSTRPASSVGRLWLHFYLPVGGTCLLLLWLSVGLAPSTWWLLFQAIRQFSTLWAQQGASVLWSFLLLIVQSLLLLAAWVLLIRLTLKEKARFKKAKQVPLPSVAVMAADPPAPPQLASSLPLLEAPTLIQPAQTLPVADQPTKLEVPPPVQAPRAEQHSPVRFLSMRKKRQVSSNPDLVTPTTRLSEAPTQISAANIAEFPTQQEIPSGRPAQSAFSSQLSASNSEQKHVKKQVKPREKANQALPKEPERNVPYEASNSYSLPDIFAQVEQIPFPEPHLMGQEKQSNNAADDPSAIPEDILRLFRQEDSPEEVEHQEVQAEPPGEQDPLFVYGNPFEGPLPDVFEHDEDLKRSIAEQGIQPIPGNQSTGDESRKSSRAQQQ